MSQQGRFQVSMGAIIECTKTKRILLLQRSLKAEVSPGEWEYITGRINQFEEPLDALKREVKEEAGIRDLQIIKPVTIFHFFRGSKKSAENELIGIVYYCTVPAENVKISDEHQAYKWVAYEQAIEIVKHPGILKDLKMWKELM